jgi:hypothetical protein
MWFGSCSNLIKIGSNNYINDFAGLPGEKTVSWNHKILNARDAPGNRDQQLDVHLQDEA